MIRANLLPRSKDSIGLFGLRLDAEYVRAVMLGFVIVVVVALLGTVIEEFRIARLTAALTQSQTFIDARSPERARAKRLALEVARYQEFARQTQLFRRSGADAAIAVARIGNGVPSGVWVDDIAHQQNSYVLSGGSRSVSDISGAIFLLGHALPANTASLVDVQNRWRSDVLFDARIAPQGENLAPAMNR